MPADPFLPTHREPFPQTRWSLVAGARASDPAEQRQAREEFCRAYWLPLYSFARAQGSSPADAEDIVQGFLSRFIDNDSFTGLDPERGKLRSYLLTGFRRFMINDWEKHSAEKRGGGQFVFSLDTNEAEGRLIAVGSGGQASEAVFDRQWASSVHRAAMAMLEASFLRRDRVQEYEVLRDFVDPAAADAEPDLHAAADALGKKYQNVRVIVHRFREDYREAIRRLVADTMDPRADVAEEVRYLAACLV